MAMPKKKSWWNTKNTGFGITIIILGLADVLARVSSIIAIPLDIILIGIGFWILWIEYKKSHQNENALDAKSTTLNSNIISIKTPELPRKLPEYYYWILLFLTGLVFVGATYELSFWIINKARFNVLGLSLFCICYFVAPPIIWFDTLYLRKKRIKENKSYVIAEKTFAYRSKTIKMVFNRCNKVLDVMNADVPTQMEVPNFIKRPLKYSNITVEIMETVNQMFNIHISSDSRRVEVRWDCGRNKRNVNKFEKLMLSKTL